MDWSVVKQLLEDSFPRECISDVGAWLTWKDERFVQAENDQSELYHYCYLFNKETNSIDLRAVCGKLPVLCWKYEIEQRLK